jgi:hypothetical protein
VYDPVEKKVHITRDVVFDESAQWDWSNDSSAENAGGKDFGVEYIVWSTRTSPEQQGVGELADQLELPQVEAPGSPIQMPKEGIDEVEPLSPGFSDTLDADHDDAPLRLRSMESILGGGGSSTW